MFSLTHESSGECYRFKSSGPVAATMWKQMIAEAKKPKVHDLIELNVDATDPANQVRWLWPVVYFNTFFFCHNFIDAVFLGDCKIMYDIALLGYKNFVR